MLVTIKIKKKNIAEPIGVKQVECENESPEAVATALQALNEVEHGGWIYGVVDRKPEEKLIVIENYPVAEVSRTPVLK